MVVGELHLGLLCSCLPAIEELVSRIWPGFLEAGKTSAPACEYEPLRRPLSPPLDLAAAAAVTKESAAGQM